MAWAVDSGAFCPGAVTLAGSTVGVTSTVMGSTSTTSGVSSMAGSASAPAWSSAMTPAVSASVVSNGLAVPEAMAFVVMARPPETVPITAARPMPAAMRRDLPWCLRESGSALMKARSGPVPSRVRATGTTGSAARRARPAPVGSSTGSAARSGRGDSVARSDSDRARRAAGAAMNSSSASARRAPVVEVVDIALRAVVTAVMASVAEIMSADCSTSALRALMQRILKVCGRGAAKRRSCSLNQFLRKSKTLQEPGQLGGGIRLPFSGPPHMSRT